jgi:hypothetical protein
VEGRGAARWAGGNGSGQPLAVGLGVEVGDALTAELAGKVVGEHGVPPSCGPDRLPRSLEPRCGQRLQEHFKAA